MLYGQLPKDTVTIYRIGQDPIKVPPERCIFTDRSRIEDGLCSRRRYLRYELGGLGYVLPFSSNEDIVVGGATHEGLDVLLQGGTIEQALAVTEDYFWENIFYPDYLLPEQQDALGWDGCNIAKAFVYSFNSTYLPQLLDTYEVMEVEEEINWLVGEAEDNKFIVMMSRPDGVLRHKETGRLWHVSHKTAQIFNDIQVEKLKIDAQRFSESMAVWAKYGEPPEGTLYNYFLKGKRYQDKDLAIDRFSSGLIHPYMQRMGPGGEPSPEMLSFVYEWNELEDYNLRSRRLGKGWERVTIYNEMDFFLYLNWLENEAVPRHKNYLKESIVGLKEEFFDTEFAQRWVTGIDYSEEEWARRVRSSQNYSIGEGIIDLLFPLQHSECFSWNKMCTYYNICWDRANLASLIEEGRLIERTPNHLVEITKIKE